jgi:hypothetical protein
MRDSNPRPPWCEKDRHRKPESVLRGSVPSAMNRGQMPSRLGEQDVRRLRRWRVLDHLETPLDQINARQ